MKTEMPVNRKSQKPAAVPSFPTVWKRCRAAAQFLDMLTVLEPQQKLKLAAVLSRMREKAGALGVPLL